MSETLVDEQPVVEPGKQDKPVRKRRRVFGEKVCQVCGDKALAHHFGALACETCKAFFRRNALYKEEKKCLFLGECPIDVKTRRFCPACRLAKCFTVGMQADLILDDEEKKQRLLKMTEKKCKKEQLHEFPEANEKSIGYFQHSPTSTVTTTGGEVTCHADQVSDMLEQAWMTVSTSSGAVDPHTVSSPGSLSVDSRWSQEDLVVDSGHRMVMLATSQGLVMGQEAKPSVACSRESIIQQSSSECSYPSTPSTPACGVAYPPDTWQPSASTSHGVRAPPLTQDATVRPCTPLGAPSHLKASFKHVSREDLPSDPYMYWRLSEEERSLLNQLSAAYQNTVLSVLQGSPPRENLDSQLVTPELCLQDFELEAANAISFAKRMEDFRQLRLDEQIALLKASTCQVLGIRSCALFVAEKEAWLTQKGYFTLAQCNQLFPNHPHTDASLTFCKTVKSIVKNDVTLYALLHCVVLFDPSDERIIDRQLINSIRDKYIILLRHYLESVYSYVHSEKYMMALQENLITYRSLCHEGKPLIKKFFPSIPNKLLIEVLDLD